MRPYPSAVPRLLGIDAGEDFESEILGRLRECTAVLALVGQQRLDARTADDRRRSDLESGWVGRGSVEAQKIGSTVVPVPLDYTGRLDPDSLPEERSTPVMPEAFMEVPQGGIALQGSCSLSLAATGVTGISVQFGASVRTLVALVGRG
ncbi:hypothetical protein ACWGKW_20215 [Streptomyces sp. NPDC054766]